MQLFYTLKFKIKKMKIITCKSFTDLIFDSVSNNIVPLFIALFIYVIILYSTWRWFLDITALKISISLLLDIFTGVF